MDRLICGRKPSTVGAAVTCAFIALVTRPTVLAAEPAAELPRVIHVSQTYNNRPFDYRIESSTEEAAFAIHRLTYPSPVTTPVEQNNTIVAEYYRPNGVRPEDPGRPGVICMHILDGDFVLARMCCSALASQGIPAIMFKLPYYDERGLPEGPRALAADPKLFVGAVSQAMEDVRRTVDLLASRPEVDSSRIGITGISLGGLVAATSAGMEPRLARAMVILAGGDLRQIIHHARETRELSQLINQLPPAQRAEVEEAVDAVDPLRHAAGLRERARQGKVLMVNAGQDEVIPRPCTEKLAAALGISNEVIWLDGLGHYTAMAELPQVLKIMAEFFGQDLPPGIEIAQAAAESQKTPQQIVALLLQQAVGFLVSEPGSGRCHFADFDLSVTPKDEETVEARLRLIRGCQGRFKIECSLPAIGEAAMGQGNYPWMVSGGKMVFKGTGSPESPPRDPLTFAEPAHLMKLRMLSGVAAGIAIAPHLLDQWLTIADDTAAEGPPAIRIASKESGEGSLRLVFRDDRTTPRELRFQIADARGTLAFRGWQTNTVAHEAMFDPPAGLEEKEVDPVELYRVFSAMFNFAVESAQ